MKATEDGEVDPLGVDVEPVAVGLEHHVDVHGGERLPQPSEQHLQRLTGVGGGVDVPDSLDESVGADPPRCCRGERGEQQSLLSGGGYTATGYLERTENADEDPPSHDHSLRVAFDTARPRNCRATADQARRLTVPAAAKEELSMTGLTAAEAADLTEHNRQVWGRTAAGYVDTFQRLTGGATTVLLDLAGVGRGTKLLDIGTGRGTLIGPAAARGASVSAIDVTPEKVARARENHPAADIRVGQ